MSEHQDLRLKELNDSMARLRAENNTQIENIRHTVDEKLQTTLDTRLTKSFGLSERETRASVPGTRRDAVSRTGSW